MHRFAMLLPLLLFASVAFVSAFFPRVLPTLTNRWYSMIGMKTRVSEEDYARVSTRSACFVIFALVVFWMAKQSLSK
ncbi:putative RDD family membrane protein YckC [Granulicella aggregans]|uniref:Putative RDD family membrane protein YckC n=1 Tax=Granulicella aggregans TaxID=474949 RepID=A0A7W8E192_9BACT|nr:putative RDD family membrane protein YckC [Granulicella aggregans]